VVAMISHVVLMKPRAALAVDERHAFVAAFERAVREIPAVRAVRVGRRLRLGAGYESSSPDIDFVAMIDFDDVAALQSYLQHPAHAELGARFGDTMALAMVYDCEVGGVADLRQWQVL
jgi:hypothetical protein